MIFELKSLLRKTRNILQSIHLQVNQAGSFLFLLTEGSLLHSEQVADVIEVVCFAVLLSDFLFDELIPVIHGEGFGRYHHFVPMSLDVVLFWRFGYIQSVEFYSSRNFLFSFENRQWYLDKRMYRIFIN